MKVIITGTTGYVGEGVMLACLDNPEIEKVLSVSRRPCGHTHPKLEEYIVPDFMALEPGDPKLQGYDAVFFIAGISSVGLKEEQYVGISHDIPLHFADIVGPKEKMTFVYLSGAGNYNSTTQMWVRIKKSTEDALVAMPFKGAYNFRPCIMWRYNGQKRIQRMQYFFWAMYPFFKIVGMWNRMSEVAEAMIAVTKTGYHKPAIECRDITKLAKNWRISQNISSMRQNEKLTERNRDRALGCLVGGAVGDALGYIIEFEQWPYIHNTYSDKGIKRYELAGNGKALISDDTQMTLFTAAGILLGMTRGCMRGEMGRIDTYCHRTYLDWLHTQQWDSRKPDERTDSWLMDVPELYARRGPGNTCISALISMENDRPVNNNSCGCGGVMRTAPLAIVDYLHGYADGDYKYCDMVAAEAARMTHKHPLGFLPSAVLNDILMQIFNGDVNCASDLWRAVMEAVERLPEIVSEPDGGKTYGELWPEDVCILSDILENALQMSTSGFYDHDAIERIGGGWTGHEALAIAIYSAVKHFDSFEDAIISSVNHSGDSDSTGAICGNIMGAIHGRSAIPEHYTNDLELLDVIEEIAEDLYTGCIVSENGENDTQAELRWIEKYCHYRRVIKN